MAARKLTKRRFRDRRYDSLRYGLTVPLVKSSPYADRVRPTLRSAPARKAKPRPATKPARSRPAYLNKVLRQQNEAGWWDWNSLPRDDGPGLGWNRPRMEKIVHDCVGVDHSADKRIAATIAVLLKVEQCYPLFHESFKSAQVRALGWLGKGLATDMLKLNQRLEATALALRERPFPTTFNQRRYLRVDVRWIDAVLNTSAPTAIAEVLESRFRHEGY